MALDYRILKMSRFRPPMDVGRVREVLTKKSEFPFQAKVILGFTASVGLEEMSIELIHQKFLAKLQLAVRYVFNTIRSKTPYDECQGNNSSHNCSQDNPRASSENQSSSQAYHDIHEVNFENLKNSEIFWEIFRSILNYQSHQFQSSNGLETFRCISF